MPHEQVCEGDNEGDGPHDGDYDEQVGRGCEDVHLVREGVADEGEPIGSHNHHATHAVQHCEVVHHETQRPCDLIRLREVGDPGKKKKKDASETWVEKGIFWSGKI